MQFPDIRGLDGAKVTRTGVGRARAMGPYKFPHLAAGAQMGAYSNSLTCALGALYRRVLYVYDKNDGTYKERQVASAEHVNNVLGNFKGRFVRGAFAPVRCGVQDYPDLYTGGKRKVYKRALEVYKRCGVMKRHAIVSGFVKVEATKLGADPRLIQTRSPVYHLGLGSFLRCNEKGFYRGVDAYFGEKTITKGLNAEEIGELIKDKCHKYGDFVAIGLDASRFDRSVSIPILEWVHDIYRMHIGKDRDMEQLLRWQLKNTGHIHAIDGKVAYTVDGGVMSGDVDTSLKGCLIMCAMVGSWLERKGLKASLLNNGDDCVVFMRRKDAECFMEGVSTHFSDLGFNIVCEEPVYEVEHVEFCQAKPVISSNGTYVMCRNPRTASVKDHMSRLNLNTVKLAKCWAGAVSDCGLALAGDMPIFHQYYDVYHRYSQGTRADWMEKDGRFANGMLWLSKRMTRRYGVTDATRISFWRAWNILPHEQRAIERYYASVNIGERFEGPIENLPLLSFQAPSTVCSLYE